MDRPIIEASGSDTRRRLRILFFGVAISFVPVILVDLLEIQILGLRWSDLPRWILLLAALPMALFPVTLGHVTVVERALDVGVLIRQSLQYALARRGVLAMRIVVSTSVVLLVAMLSGGLPLRLRVVLTASGIWLVLLVGVGSERAARWIDRRFFREAYNVEQVLQQLAEQVMSIVELTPLLETVTSRLASLQASLRGQTLSGVSNINHLVANVNSLVYAASSVNRYATFFMRSTARRSAC